MPLHLVDVVRNRRAGVMFVLATGNCVNDDLTSLAQKLAASETQLTTTLIVDIRHLTGVPSDLDGFVRDIVSYSYTSNCGRVVFVAGTQALARLKHLADIGQGRAFAVGEVSEAYNLSQKNSAVAVG